MTVAMQPQAPLVIYRNELTMAFNRRKKLLFDTVLNQFQAKGYQAVFDVVDSGQGYAGTRGANGYIPAEAMTQTQYTATLEARFAKDVMNKEVVLGSQGDVVSAMTESAVGKINRTIDQQIITTLGTATQTAWNGTPLTAISQNNFAALKAKLLEARVPGDGNIFAVINPSVEAQMYDLPGFANSLFSNKFPIPNADLDWKDEIKRYDYLGIKFIVIPGLPGMGTASETNFIYHKMAVGLAADLSGGAEASPTVDAGYDGKEKQYWVNADFLMGAKVIQNTGIYKFYTNGTALANVPA